MITAVLFFLLSASFLVLILKKTRLAVLFSFLTLLWFVFIGFGFVPELLLTELQTAPRMSAPEWKERNLIILLGGGKTKWHQGDNFTTHALAVSRVFEAARLYHSCRASAVTCDILVSGGDPSGLKKSEAEIMAAELSAVGVFSSNIIKEDKSNNTYQNAKFSAPLVLPYKYDQIYLVTSGYHMSRSQILFSHFGMQTVAAPADLLTVSGRRLYSSGRNFMMADIGAHEFVGILQFYMYNWLGINS